MRPLHPLPPLFPSAGSDRPLKKKRRVQVPLVRARRQRIDPTKYGSVHISGVLLDSSAIIAPSSPRPSKMLQVAPPTLGLQKANEKPKKETPNDLGAEVFATPKSLKSQETEKVFAAERARNLALLSGLFGNKDVWEGREDSAGDKVESGEYDEEGDIALGPTRQGREPMPAETSAPVIAEERILPPHSPLVSSNDQPDESASISEAQTEVKRLKDLFAPAAEPGE
jgi:hypothetical protein